MPAKKYKPEEITVSCVMEIVPGHGGTTAEPPRRASIVTPEGLALMHLRSPTAPADPPCARLTGLRDADMVGSA